MRTTNLFMPTMREVPAEAESDSHKLMLRAGLIRKLASGIYCFLPLGLKAMKKLEDIIREEMDAAGAVELLMSAMIPAEPYKESGRWEVFGPEMFRLKDRNKRDFCMGPTHEEIFTDIVKHEVRSYRALPLMLYQIQTKFRDEIRPRFGVIRSREFVMKDAYSFDRDEAGLDLSYEKMYNAYCKIFERCGLEFVAVDADTGAMGGSGSQEFMVKSEIGENTIAYCDSCGYAANDEKAPCISTGKKSDTAEESLVKLLTPSMRTIEEITSFLSCSPTQVVKTLIYMADDKVIAALVRGDRELNEAKLKNLLGCTMLEMASPEKVYEITSANVGFAGPIGLKELTIVVDNEVSDMKNFVVGANDTDYHYLNVNLHRDFKADITADIRNIALGDVCPLCTAPIALTPGLEIGHIFKLGTKYTKALNCVYVDENGQEIPMVMGSYGIGLNRTIATIIEQSHDENGIIWPIAIAPYQVAVVPANMGDTAQVSLAEEIYIRLKAIGIEVLLDDRNERTGVKFKDTELIGVPVRITVGRKAAEAIVEVKNRKESDAVDMGYEAAIEYCRNLILG